MNRLDFLLLLFNIDGVDDGDAGVEMVVVVVLDGITNPSTTPTETTAAAAAKESVRTFVLIVDVKILILNIE